MNKVISNWNSAVIANEVYETKKNQTVFTGYSAVFKVATTGLANLFSSIAQVVGIGGGVLLGTGAVAVLGLRTFSLRAEEVQLVFAQNALRGTKAAFIVASGLLFPLTATSYFLSATLGTNALARANFVLNRFENRMKDNLVQREMKKQIPQTITLKAPVIYHKGQTRTRDMGLSTVKKPIGIGGCGSIHQLNNDSTKVVKKMLFIQGTSDFEIGQQISHPNIMKTYEMYIKKYDSGLEDHKLVLEKVEGQTLRTFCDGKEKISKEISINLLEQAKEVCLYLFDQGITWVDVHEDNIFVDKDNNLKIIDLGCWKKCENDQQNTANLLLGGAELTQRIVDSSFLRADDQKSEELIRSIWLNNATFIDNRPIDQIYSLDTSLEWYGLTKTADKVKNLKPSKRKEFLANYFDTAINLMKQQ